MYFKGELFLYLKMSMFYVLSKNYQAFFQKIMHASESKMSKELKNNTEILVGQADQTLKMV